MKKTIYSLAYLSFMVVFLIASVFYFSFDRSFYTKFYSKNNSAEIIGIEEEELEEATDILLDYILMKRNDLDYTINGEDFFNQREIDHMYDVKELYKNSRNISFGLLIFSLVVFLRFVLVKDYKDKGLVYNIILSSLLSYLFIILLISLWIFVDFNSFFTTFHEIIFTNDLWLLNPLTDRLIMMVPELFFTQLINKVIYTNVIFLLIQFVWIYRLGRRTGYVAHRFI